MGCVASMRYTGLLSDGGRSLLRLLGEVSVLPVVFPFSIGRIKLGGARRNFFLRLPDGEVAMGVIRPTAFGRLFAYFFTFPSAISSAKAREREGRATPMILATSSWLSMRP